MTTAGKTAISTSCIYIFGAHKLKDVSFFTLYDLI